MKVREESKTFDGCDIMSTQVTFDNWLGFSASVPGNGHIRYGIPCQDASLVITSPRPAMIVCDGRGSAKLSHLGAQEAIRAFKCQIGIMDPFLKKILDCEGECEEQWIKFCRIMYRTLMQVKCELSEAHNLPENEFDFTVVFAIVGKSHIGCFQVGDGALVLRQNGVCITVFPPEKGEFANQTHFLRAGGEEQTKFQYALFETGDNSGIAASSDGPEHLMFRLSDMKPGEIFNRLFDDLKANQLCRQDIMDYLTRREWGNDPRGADDRSLALLLNPLIAGQKRELKDDMEISECAEEAKDASSEKEAPNNPDVAEADSESRIVAEIAPIEQGEVLDQSREDAPNHPDSRIASWTKKLQGKKFIVLLIIGAISGFFYGFRQNALYREILDENQIVKEQLVASDFITQQCQTDLKAEQKENARLRRINKDLMDELEKYGVKSPPRTGDEEL